MESSDELKEININIKNIKIDDITKIEDFILITFYWMRHHMKIFWFMAFLARL